MHDGSRIVLRKLDAGLRPDRPRRRAGAHPGAHASAGEYLTGLLHVESSRRTSSTRSTRPRTQPLNSLPYEALSPGSKGLEKMLARYR